MDPLKPFTTLIRSLSASRSAKSPQTAQARSHHTDTDPQTSAAAAGIMPASAVHSRLQARLSALTEWDSKRARETFVECILLNELGAQLAEDPAFFELVRRVSINLDSEPQISSRLDQVLRELAAGPHLT